MESKKNADLNLSDENLRKLSDEELDSVAGGAVPCGEGMTYDWTVGHCVEVSKVKGPFATV